MYMYGICDYLYTVCTAASVFDFTFNINLDHFQNKNSPFGKTRKRRERIGSHHIHAGLGQFAVKRTHDVI